MVSKVFLCKSARMCPPPTIVRGVNLYLFIYFLPTPCTELPKPYLKSVLHRRVGKQLQKKSVSRCLRVYLQVQKPTTGFHVRPPPFWPQGASWILGRTGKCLWQSAPRHNIWMTIFKKSTFPILQNISTVSNNRNYVGRSHSRKWYCMKI